MEYRDDTLSFDRYECEEPEPVKVQGTPDGTSIYYFDIYFRAESLQMVGYQAAEDAGLAVVKHSDTHIGYCTVGIREGVKGQVVAAGLVKGILADSATMKYTAIDGVTDSTEL